MARTFTRTITTPAAARMVRATGRPAISLLTDFGSRDPSAGIMRAVVQAIAPDAVVTDISHDVEKFHVRDAALLLWCAVPYLTIGAHVAVVDPGVGTERRSIAMETARGDHLVGPDNGILLPAAARLGGIVRVHQLETPQYRLPIISSSFHGRDVFAPAAAHLAMGVPLEFLGPPVDPRSLRLLDWPEPEVYAGVLRSSVIYLDTFGNVKLSALGEHLYAALGDLRFGERLFLRVTDPGASFDVEVTWVETFGRVPPGQPLLYEDSYGRLGFAVNQGSAVQVLGIRDDAEVLVTRVQLPRPMSDDAGPSVPMMDAPQAMGLAADPQAYVPVDAGFTGDPQPWEPQPWEPQGVGSAPGAQPWEGQPGPGLAAPGQQSWVAPPDGQPWVAPPEAPAWVAPPDPRPWVGPEEPRSPVVDAGLAPVDAGLAPPVVPGDQQPPAVPRTQRSSEQPPPVTGSRLRR